MRKSKRGNTNMLAKQNMIMDTGHGGAIKRRKFKNWYEIANARA